jgi:hypothetical protein
MVVSPTAVSLPERYQDLHLDMDFVSASAALDSRPMVLTRKEYALLSLLVQNAGEIIPRDALLWDNLELRPPNPHPYPRRAHPPASAEARHLRRNIH